MKKILWSERVKRTPKALTFETYLRGQDNPISSHPEARDPRIVPLVVLDYGSTMARIRQMGYGCNLPIEKCPVDAIYTQTKPTQMAARYLSITRNALTRLQTKMAVTLVLNTVLLATVTLTGSKENLR